MASKKPSGLGRGLGALLGDDVMKTESSGSLSLPISQVETCSSQPRKRFDDESLQELADSISQHGIIQPLTVRKLSSGYYQIIAGERRWRAARLAGLQEVPVIVIEADDRKAAELAMIENLQREDLNPMEEAAGFQSLIESYHMTQEEAAQRVGKSRSAVTNALRLLGRPPSESWWRRANFPPVTPGLWFPSPLPCRKARPTPLSAADSPSGRQRLWSNGFPPRRKRRRPRTLTRWIIWQRPKMS